MSLPDRSLDELYLDYIYFLRWGAFTKFTISSASSLYRENLDNEIMRDKL